jgi:RecA-family ATPase
VSIVGSSPGTGNESVADNAVQATPAGSQYPSGGEPQIAAPAPAQGYQYANIPQKLCDTPQWALAGPEKAPYLPGPIGPYNVSVHEERLLTFENAVTTVQRLGPEWGIGYVLRDTDPFTCIDLDVKDNTTEEQLARFTKIVEAFDSYTERSRSGKGAHVWIEGSIGEGKKRDGVEVYSQERFIVCTGDVVRDKPIAPRQQLLETLRAEMDRAAPPEEELEYVEDSDNDALSLAKRALDEDGNFTDDPFGRLFAGHWQDHYPSQSEADLALVTMLCRMTPSNTLAWNAFRLSRLGRRDKAARRDYKLRTLRQARAMVARDTEMIAHGREVSARLFTNANVEHEIKSNLATPNLAGLKGWPSPLDLIELSRRDPEPPRMIINDWLPVGYATLIAGHGGAGKSSIALYLAVCIALGIPFFGLPTQRRRVLYASCEDRADVLHWRLARICTHLRVNLADLAGHLMVLDLVGQNVTLWDRTAAGGNVTKALKLLAEAIHEHDTPAVFVDGVADVFGGNENDRGDVKRFVNALVGLIPPGAGALVLIHHVNKESAGSGTSEGYSGSTGWHNSVRARWYLYPETEATDEGVNRTGDLLLELQKSNLGRADHSMKFRWDESAHLFVGQVAHGISVSDHLERDETEREGILAALREVEEAGDYVPAAMQGSRTAHHVLSVRSSFPETLKSKAATKRFRRHIEHLRAIQEIHEDSMKRKNGKAVLIITLRSPA